MLADSGRKKGCYHSLNWVTADKAKNLIGGSETGKQPHVRMEDEKVYHINVKCYPTYQEEPQLRNDPIPHREAKPTILTVELNQQSTRLSPHTRKIIILQNWSF